MPEATDTGFLSIGEVLGLLLEEFPDITISKIRFLESQGLISPERTASGYRKFYSDDVDLLKVILREQRRNYLPLRVIKDRLDSGQIDPTGEHDRPDDGVEAMAADEPAPAPPSAEVDEGEQPAAVPRASIKAHPASRRKSEPEPEPEPARKHRAPADDQVAEPPAAESQLLPGVLLERSELCAMCGMTDDELTQLETFGIVSPRPGSPVLYNDDSVAIAKPACEFLRLGVDARHLRNWRTSAEREASLYEQLVTPRYRQRNPEARAEALSQLRRLDVLGATLRAAMTRQALRHHFES
jgi:DNA-binding transcriptional MerR regulator